MNLLSEIEESQKKHIIILLVVVLVIWGYNMYSFIGLATGDDKMVNKQVELKLDSVRQVEIPEPYRYKDDFRNPFAYHDFYREKIKKKTPYESKPSRKKQEPKIVLPDLNVTGIIDNTAIIQYMNRNVYVVGAGDVIKGVEIAGIYKDSVQVKYRDKHFVINVKSKINTITNK